MPAPHLPINPRRVVKDAVIAIISTVAKHQRARISERVQAGLDAPRAKGMRLAGPNVVVDVDRIANFASTWILVRWISDDTGFSKGRPNLHFLVCPKSYDFGALRFTG